MFFICGCCCVALLYVWAHPHSRTSATHFNLQPWRTDPRGPRRAFPRATGQGGGIVESESSGPRPFFHGSFSLARSDVTDGNSPASVLTKNSFLPAVTHSARGSPRHNNPWQSERVFASWTVSSNTFYFLCNNSDKRVEWAGRKQTVITTPVYLCQSKSRKCSTGYRSSCCTVSPRTGVLTLDFDSIRHWLCVLSLLNAVNFLVVAWLAVLLVGQL